MIIIILLFMRNITMVDLKGFQSQSQSTKRDFKNLSVLQVAPIFLSFAKTHFTQVVIALLHCWAV